MTMTDSPDRQQSYDYIRSRIANACDGCKARKVKCDGELPCSHCIRHGRSSSCRFSPQKRRRRHLPRSPPPSGPASVSASESVLDSGRMSSGTVPGTPTMARGPPYPAAATSATSAPGMSLPHPASPSAEDETEVPREARLLCDAQGKLVFIGDCAPLSFFQTVRQLVTNKVGETAFAPQTTRYSMLENARPKHSSPARRGPPFISQDIVHPALSNYLAVTTGLFGLFDDSRLFDDVSIWANLGPKPDDVESIVNYLVLAIGCQKDNEELAQAFFEYARDQALANLDGNLSVPTVQAFILITMYMLGACQVNGAFLFFGLSVRAAYSIGIHRTEVNARFGPDIHRQRDRLWKSLRVVDLFLSTSMGRPPATSDIDCTVPYRSVNGEDGKEVFDLLNASVQILLIVEVIVVEVYSRRKISLQLTEGISRRLREWSLRWLHRLKEAVSQQAPEDAAEVGGACQVLSTYYYAVMLISRPFLMYELCRRLSDGSSADSRKDPTLISSKTKLADACIDAASLMVETVHDVIGRGFMTGRLPLIVSWLFASSLVLGVGLLGGFGRILEKYTRTSIQTLGHFAKNDAHAMQYSLIGQTLLNTALEYLEKKEIQERLKRTESSSQLFGLIPPGAGECTEPLAGTGGGAAAVRYSMSPATAASGGRFRDIIDGSASLHPGYHSGHVGSPRFGDLDSAFMGLSESMSQATDMTFLNGSLEGDDDQSFGCLNLFPLLEAAGHIDLAHYL